MGNVSSASFRKSSSKQKTMEKKVKGGSKNKNKKSKSKSRFNSTTKTDTSTSVSSELASQGEIVLTKDSPVPADCPEELKLIRDFIRYKDEHNLKKMRELTSDGCYFNFTDAETEMPAHEFYEAMQDIYASFPDLHFFWKSKQYKPQLQPSAPQS